jgi:murein DD-endopeptidase MepM/ murein hydrolase activator NlpD
LDLHATYRRRRHADRTDAVQFGNEPPLYVAGDETTARLDRRRVSVHWLAGTVLTGVFGAALMGGAVFAALDGETQFASAPEYATTAAAAATQRQQAAARKADRLAPVVETVSAKQVVRVSHVTRVGDRETVRVRPFTRLATNLALSTTELSANIPAFNPQRLFAEPNAPTQVADNTPEAEQDADISVVVRDLAGVPLRSKPNTTLALDDVVAKVRDTAAAQPGRVDVALGAAASGRMSFAGESDPSDPYSGFDVRVIPENVSYFAKTSDPPAPVSQTERTVTVKKGDTITSILREGGATPEEARAVAQALGPRGRDNGLKPDQRLRILWLPAPNGQRLSPARVIVLTDATVEAIVAQSDTTGRYVAVDVPRGTTETTVAQQQQQTDEEAEDDGTGVRLYQSIYETALRQDVPRTVIQELIKIYSYDVDFNRRVQAGDSFEVLYAIDDESHGKPDVLYASLTVGGELKQYYRFATPDDGVVDYYDETGKSAKKFLMRKPMAGGTFRSPFGMRRHPILGYAKMHTGVDWAAPTGTPVFASGNGTVEKAGWSSGYGRQITIQHTNGYETAYAHLSAFARGIEPGARVRQGQVIAFVGSTGLSTGPHLHYEVLVNGRYVDPMRIRLPRGRVLEGRVLADFEKERDRLDALMNRSTTPRVASEPGDRRGNQPATTR